MNNKLDAAGDDNDEEKEQNGEEGADKGGDEEHKDDALGLFLSRHDEMPVRAEGPATCV